MPINLDDCKLITSREYMSLDSPVFKGQTKLDKDGGYFMVWEHNGILYKTYQIL